MRSGSPRRDGNLRRRIALEAARLISEDGLRDFRHALRKAAANLGVTDESALPRNEELEAALREHQRLFHADDHAATLRRLRETAREAMRFFAACEPRLVGAVLDGTADRHSAVCLHLHADRPEEVLAWLSEQRIPHETRTRRMRRDEQRSLEATVVRFSADGTEIDLTLLPHDALQHPPLDRSSGRPMQRATAGALEALLADAT